MAIFRREPPNGGVECSYVSKNRDSGHMAGGVRTTTATVDCAVYRTYRHASVNLVYHNQHGRPRRREENRTKI